jgi:hypothetical protein
MSLTSALLIDFVPPSSHFIFIPAVLTIGVILGFIFGSKATRDAIAFEQKKEQERQARKAAREASKASQPSPPAQTSDK